MARMIKYCWSILLGLLLLFGLWITTLQSYLLFHCLAEIFSIIVAFGIFMLAWNSRRFAKNSYLLFIGIAYLFIGVLDLTHTLAYKGMGVFLLDEANLSTQLWIAARYVESASLLIAAFLVGRKLKANFAFIGYILITAVLLGSIFYWNIFPICYVEGDGLTTFKKVSEYIISFILIASIIALLQKRHKFDKSVLQLLIASIVVTIVSELAFTMYTDVYGLSNFIGHYLKIISFYLIYVAIIKTGLTRPFALLFRDLKQSEEALRAAKEHLELEVGESSEKLHESIIKLHDSELRYRSVVEDSPGLICSFEPGGIITCVNDTCCNYFGKNQQELVGTSFFTFIPEEDRETVEANIAALTPEEPIQMHEHRVINPDGQIRWQRWTNRAIFDKDGQAREYQSFGEDITNRKQAELAVHEMASFAELNPAPVLRVNFDGLIMSCNPASVEILGKHAKKGTSLTSILPDLSKIVLDNCMQGDLLLTHESRIKARYYQFIIRGVSDLSLVYIYGSDITERKQVEKALQMSETNLVKAQEVGHIGSWSLDLLENNLIWSDENYRIFGVSKGTPMTYEKFLEVVHPEDRDYVDKEWSAAIKGEPYDIEHRLLIDNEVKWVREKAELIFDDRGNPTSGVGITQDITERRRAEKLLKDSEARFRMIYEHAPVMIDAFDGNGRCVMWNKECEKVFGWTAEEIFSHENPLILFYPDPEVQRQVVETVTSKPQKVFREWKPRRKDGSETTCLWANFKLPDGLVINLGYDITERKQAEEDLHQLREELLHATRMGTMSEFLASLAHEINHPLGSILNNANAAKRFLENKKPDLDEIREIIDDIISEDRRANDVIQKLRGLMRKAESKYTPLKTNVIIEEVLSLTHSELVIEGISLSKHLEKNLPKVKADRIQLQQVLLNLIINAADAMKESKVKNLSISTSKKDSQDIIVCVMDSGKGIDENKKDNLFKPFVTTKKEGMGMGLSVNKTIIKAFGGDVWAENNKDGGASFFITLPIYKEKSS